MTGCNPETCETHSHRDGDGLHVGAGAGEEIEQDRGNDDVGLNLTQS